MRIRTYLTFVLIALVANIALAQQPSIKEEKNKSDKPIDHLGFEPTYRERVSLTYYEAGHMMYIRPSMLEKFKQDVAQFIRDSKDAALKTTE